MTWLLVIYCMKCAVAYPPSHAVFASKESCEYVAQQVTMDSSIKAHCIQYPTK